MINMIDIQNPLWGVIVAVVYIATNVLASKLAERRNSDKQ